MKEMFAPTGAFNGDDNLKNADHTAGRHTLDRHEGFQVGQYIQGPPLYFNRLEHPQWIGDLYRGRSLFIIASGPSFAKLDHDLLRQPGLMTMGLNNSPRTFRPDIWVSADDPPSFIKSIWVDPKIMKFCPLDHAEKTIFDSMTWRMTQVRVGDCPNVYHYKRNDFFQPKQFLTENSINWGNHGDRCVGCGSIRQDKKQCKQNGVKFSKVCPKCKCDLYGARTVMLPALRTAYHLGFRNVYLLGVDFQMSHGMESGYHFQQSRAKGAVNNNNDTYRALELRFGILKPIFDAAGFHVMNCNPDSALKAFPYVKYEDAVQNALNGFPDWKNERTEGLYSRKADEKAAAKEPPVVKRKIQTFADFERRRK